MEGTKKTFFLIYSMLLATIGLFASDMYLPALAEIQNFYQTDTVLVGLSLSIFMAGFSIAQLFYGTISDQIGRTTPLIIGLLLFSAGTIGCIFSASINSFLFFRFIQAIGVGAAYVLWQPMVVDLFDGNDVQKIFSLLMAISALSPAIAPLLGGYLTALFSWKMVFWVLLGITTALLLWTSFVYKESLPIQHRRSLSLHGFFGGYHFFLTSRFFMGHIGAIACGMSMYMAFLLVEILFHVRC